MTPLWCVTWMTLVLAPCYQAKDYYVGGLSVHEASALSDEAVIACYFKTKEVRTFLFDEPMARNILKAEVSKDRFSSDFQVFETTGVCR